MTERERDLEYQRAALRHWAEFDENGQRGAYTPLTREEFDKSTPGKDRSAGTRNQ